MPTSDITVVIPTIAPRNAMLQRAMRSVFSQTLVPYEIIVEEDQNKEGAPYTRDRGFARVQTEWVAFLDDDDELYTEHLELLHTTAVDTGADLVYPWFDVIGGTDPFPQWEGVEWRNDEPHQIPVTWLGRTEVVRAAGGFSGGWDPLHDPGTDRDGNRAGEDFQLILRLCAAEAKIVHVNRRTWGWHHHWSNTMGLPSRW